MVVCIGDCGDHADVDRSHPLTSPPTTPTTTHLKRSQRKIKKAFCPPEVVEGNPVVDYVKHIIFGYYGKMDVAFQVRGRSKTS